MAGIFHLFLEFVMQFFGVTFFINLAKLYIRKSCPKHEEEEQRMPQDGGGSMSIFNPRHAPLFLGLCLRLVLIGYAHLHDRFFRVSFLINEEEAFNQIII
jgi:hypothetical protein